MKIKLKYKINYEAYWNFIQKLTSVTGQIAPDKTKKVTSNSKEWFSSVVFEGMNNRGRLFNKLKKPWLPLNQENYKKARYENKKLITEKEKTTLKRN